MVGLAKIADAGVVRRIAARGHGGERVADRVEQRHPRGPVGQHTGRREQQVDEPQGLGGAGDARRELRVLHRPWSLGLEELHAADAEQRQQRDGEHHDADAAEPLDLLAVVEDRRRQVVQPDEHRGAGGRESGHRFEDGFGHRHAGQVCEEERHGAGQPDDGPEQHDHQEAVAQPEIAALPARRQPREQSRRQQDQERVDEQRDLAVGVQRARPRPAPASSR